MQETSCIIRGLKFSCQNKDPEVAQALLSKITKFGLLRVHPSGVGTDPTSRLRLADLRKAPDEAKGSTHEEFALMEKLKREMKKKCDGL